MSQLFHGEDDPVPAAGVSAVDDVESTVSVGSTGGELVDYRYQQCLLRQWYKSIWIYMLGVLAAMMCVWVLKRSLRFVWNLLGLVSWLKPFMDGMKLFYLIVTCCGRCAFDMTSCLVGCLMQVGRLCGFLEADNEVGDNGPDGGASGVADGGVNQQRLNEGDDSVEEVGDAGGAAGVAGVESIKMKKLGASRDRIAKVHGGGGGNRVEDVGAAGNVSPRFV